MGYGFGKMGEWAAKAIACIIKEARDTTSGSARVSARLLSRVQENAPPPR